jgi:two-component system, NarL family, response regulator DesR
VTEGTAIVPAVVAHEADIAVVDIDLPGADGIIAARELGEQYPQCRVLILTALAKPGNLRRALAARVAGFLPKETPAADLVNAVRTIAAGGRVIDPQLALLALEVPDNPLSAREAEVLRRFGSGAESAEIAAAMYLTQGTVRNYLASAVTKLGSRNRVDAVRMAAEAGWLLRGLGLERFVVSRAITRKTTSPSAAGTAAPLRTSVPTASGQAWRP